MFGCAIETGDGRERLRPRAVSSGYVAHMR